MKIKIRDFGLWSTMKDFKLNISNMISLRFQNISQIKKIKDNLRVTVHKHWSAGTRISLMVNAAATALLNLTIKKIKLRIV